MQSAFGPPTSSAASWLGIVFVQTSILCVLQVIVGVFSHSLALLGDSVHALMDCCSYGFGYGMERLKQSTTVKAVSPAVLQHRILMLDVVSSFLSLLLLIYSCAAVVDEAFARLRDRGVELDETAPWDALGHHDYINATKLMNTTAEGGGQTDQLSVDGGLMFGFSICSTFVNLYLLHLGTQQLQQDPTVKPIADSWFEFFHNIFHPHHTAAGAHGHQCQCQAHAHTSSGFNKKRHSYRGVDEMEKGFNAKPAQSVANLNLVTQWLHVLMDAVRGILLIIASFFIYMEWVDDVTTDAVVGIAVAIMITIGALGLLPHLYRQSISAMKAEVNMLVLEERGLEDGEYDYHASLLKNCD